MSFIKIKGPEKATKPTRCQNTENIEKAHNAATSGGPRSIRALFNTQFDKNKHRAGYQELQNMGLQ